MNNKDIEQILSAQFADACWQAEIDAALSYLESDACAEDRECEDAAEDQLMREIIEEEKADYYLSSLANGEDLDGITERM